MTLFLSAPHMGKDEERLVAEVFASNWVAPTGPMVTEFERRLSLLSGISHVAALSSGTAALHLALRLSGVGSGDEVWCATMTFIGGASPILFVGATPVFVDIDPHTFLIDLDLLEESLEARARTGTLPRAVITTDLYGHMPDMGRLAGLKERYGFVWISDAAESVGSYRDGRHAGQGADFAVFSFNGNKIITTSGGGALASDNASAIEQARFLSTQARDRAPHYEHTTYGYNYRLSNVCAAIGVGQLNVLADRVARRQAINAAYRAQLGNSPGLSFSPEDEGSRANRWLTTVLIDPETAGFDRETARLALEAEQIESRPLWKPMHLQPVFRDAPTIGGSAAARAFEQGLCLPSWSKMTDGDVERVAGIVARLAG